MKKIGILIITLYTLHYSCQSNKTKNRSVDEPHKEKFEVFDTTNKNLPVLHLRGTSYEIGFQHGSLMKNRIIELVDLWKIDLEKTYSVPADDFIEVFLNSTKYILALEKWTPGLLEEIKGISDGAGIDFNTMFTFQLVDEISTNARLLELSHHCTSLGINNFKIDSSSNFIAQNIDVTQFYHGFEILLDIQYNDSDSRILVPTFAGYIGANGLNDNIGINVNSLKDMESSLDGLPVCCVVRGVLNRNSFKSAKEFIHTIKHAAGQNYIIGSRQDLASFECSANQVVEYWPDSSKVCTYHANNALANTSYHPKYKQYLKDSLNQTPETYRFNSPINTPRMKDMELRLFNNDSIDLETIKDILSSKDNKIIPICNVYTWVSTIMELGVDHNKLLLSPGKPDSTEYIVFTLEK